MDKITMIGFVIEACIFLIPFLTVMVKLGKTLEKVEQLEKKVASFNNIDSKLSVIENKIDMLIGGKIKIET